jgi:hypothetical protein
VEAFLVRVFATEIAMQCRIVQESWRELTATTDSVIIWREVQGLLAAAAMLSKLLWGINAAAAARRKPLRDALGVLDSSPLYSRDVRNLFEHVDEKIEKWHAENPDGAFVSRNLGWGNPGVGGVGDPTTYFHGLDRRTWVVTFFGKAVDLPGIVAAVEQLLPAAERESR